MRTATTTQSMHSAINAYVVEALMAETGMAQWTDPCLLRVQTAEQDEIWYAAEAVDSISGERIVADFRRHGSLNEIRLALRVTGGTFKVAPSIPMSKPTTIDLLPVYLLVIAALRDLVDEFEKT